MVVGFLRKTWHWLFLSPGNSRLEGGGRIESEVTQGY
jgi:hypothetical protein